MNSVTSSWNYRDIQAEQEMNEGAAATNLCGRNNKTHLQLVYHRAVQYYHIYIVVRYIQPSVVYRNFNV